MSSATSADLRALVTSAGLHGKRRNRRPLVVEPGMPLSDVQKGLIGETEASKILMMTSDGDLELDFPVTDDERRDREVHERGHFGLSIALQVKVTMYLDKRPGNESPVLHIQFTVESERLISHPLFWYLFAYLDPDTMTFREPIFLVDSKTLHEHAWKKRVGKKIHLEFQGSLSSTSEDVWAPFRVSRRELGKRVLQIIRNAEKSSAAKRLPSSLPAGPGTVRVRARRPGTQRKAA